ncbi:MAG: endonuclease domain-containing protein [Candidatus Dormibacteraceae bacterium]
MESRLRMLLVLGGLPRPEAQVELFDASGRFVARVDLFYPEPGVAVEYDGANHRERLVEDNRRQNRLQEIGVHLLRYTSPDLRDRLPIVVAEVRAALDTHTASKRASTAPE